MKKRIIIPAILSAVLATGLTSCVKDNESDSVRDLRNAKANELNANAKQTESATKINEAAAAVKLKSDEAELAKKLADVKKSELDVKIKEFDVKIKELSFATAARVEADAARVSAENAAGSQGRIDAKVIEANAAVVSATAAVASATAAFEKAKHNVEIAKLDAEIALAKAQSKKSEVEAATASATLALIKAQQKLAGEKADAYEEAVTDFANAVVSVTTKKGEIEQKKNTIKGLEEGVVTATAYVERQTAVKNADIAAHNKAIEVLEASKQYTTAQLKALYQEELAKYENAMNVYSDEFNSRKREEIGEEVDRINNFDFRETDIVKAFKAITDFYNENIGIYKPDGHYGGNLFSDYLEQPHATYESKQHSNGVYSYAFYWTGKPVKINVVGRQKLQHAVAQIEQKAVNDQIKLDRLNDDQTKSHSVAYAELKMNEAKTAWEEAKAAQPPVEATINARWTTYQARQTDYQNKLNERKEVEKALAPANKHKEVYNKAIAQLSTAGLENYNAVVTKRNEAVAKHFEQQFKEENLKLVAGEFEKKANEYKAILGATGSTVTGTYVYIDNKINEHKEKIEKLKAEIATFSEIITAEDALNQEKQRLAKLEAELVALEAKVVALKAKADALKP